LVPRSDELEGQKSEVKVTGTKDSILAPSAACVQFLFGKTSLAFSLFIYLRREFPQQ